MCVQAILENGRTLKFVPHCRKNHERCNKAVDIYSHALEFFPECFMTQKMCEKSVNNFPSLEWFITKEMFDKAVDRCFLAFYFIPDWYKTQDM